MDFLRKLPIPMDIKAEYPLSESGKKIKECRDREIRSVFMGEDSRLLLIVGPCSADREDAVMDYLFRLAETAEKVKDKVVIIPRVYCSKPRSAGDGYMGMLHQPDPNAAPDLLEGLISIRKLHRRVLQETGFTAADEMLYPDNHRYLSDLLGYAAIGARSVENQQHRLTASGLDIPVGMKNPTGGDLSVAANAVYSARLPHRFIYRGWEVDSSGNPLAHGILRGYSDDNGNPVPNYSYEDLSRFLAVCEEKEIDNPSVIVDASHCNSGKDCFCQPEVCMDVLNSRKRSKQLNRFVKGLMIESYLVDGAQNVGGGIYGCSITDSCLGWEKTEKLIYDIAGRL